MLNYLIALKCKSKPKYFVKIDFNITFLAEFPKNLLNQPIFVIFS